VYGWASWTPAKGILVLRNPGAETKTISLKLKDAFELPVGAAERYSARRPWREDVGKAVLELNAAEMHEFTLAPFEVLTLEMTPR
jgi:hypothetical protein